MTDDRIGRALAVLGATVAQISAIDDEVIREHVEEAYALVRAEYAARQVERRDAVAEVIP